MKPFLKFLSILAIGGLVYLFYVFFELGGAVEKKKDHVEYCEGVQRLIHLDYKNTFHSCEGYGIRLSRSCRAISVGNAAGPEYLIFCEGMATQSVNHIPMEVLKHENYP